VTLSDFICRWVAVRGFIWLWLLAFGACQYDVPITPAPTRGVDQRLLGDWTSADGKEQMNVRRLDDSSYVVYYDGDLFRAYHSDFAGASFASVQDLNSNDSKYAYVVWKLSGDGKNLMLWHVSDKVVPKETADPAVVVALLTKNAHNSELLGEQIEFRKVK
jgi:hypothetical protein